MKKSIKTISAILGVSIVFGLMIYSNLPTKCPKCGRVMKPGEWHVCR